jgi:hypothetical protein
MLTFLAKLGLNGCLPCLIWAALVAASGCSDGKVVVRGTVAVDGQPIDEGMISLEPADGQGPTTGGLIKAGKYELTGNAAVSPGDKIVRIVGLRQTGKMVEAGPPAPKGTLIPQMEQCVPSQYNDKSQLRAEVTPGMANTHDFKLVSKVVPGSPPK